MKLQYFLLAGNLLLHSLSFAQVPAKQWDRTLGGRGEERLNSMQPTRDGGSILAGVSESPISGDKTQANQGEDDFWVVKLSAQGQKQWDRTLGGSDYDGATCVQQTSDGGYIVGGYSFSDISSDKTQARQGIADYWVVKLDAQGQPQWDRTLGGTGDEMMTSIVQTLDGGYLLGGYSASLVSGDKTGPNRGKSDYWVVKLDAQGTKQWDRTLGGTGVDILQSVRQTVDGGYLLGGSSLSPISGDKTQDSQGSADYWLVKLDAQGTKQWDRTLGGNAGDYLGELQLTPDGGALLAGHSSSGATGDKTQPGLGKSDYWLVKVDVQGQQQWDRTLGTADEDWLTSLALTPDGGYLLGGDNSGTYPLLKLDAQGNKQWTHALNAGGGYNHLMQVRIAADGGYLLGGMSAGGVVDDKSEPSRGGVLYGDYWVVKLAATVLANRPAAVPGALQVFPNPAPSAFTVRLPDATPRAGLHLELVNVLGRVVFAQTLPSAAQFTVPAGVAPAGLYWVRLRGPQGYQATQRLVLN